MELRPLRWLNLLWVTLGSSFDFWLIFSRCVARLCYQSCGKVGKSLMERKDRQHGARACLNSNSRNHPRGNLETSLHVVWDFCFRNITGKMNSSAVIYTKHGIFGFFPPKTREELPVN